MIYHLTTPEAWAASAQESYYTAPSLAIEGFIHCSTEAQVAGVLERFYEGVPAILMLHIDETLLTAPVVYEPATDVADTFPHVFGGINREAIVKVTQVRG